MVATPVHAGPGAQLSKMTERVKERMHEVYTIAKHTASTLTKEPEDANDTIMVTIALLCGFVVISLLVTWCAICAIRSRMRRQRIGTPSAKPPVPLPTKDAYDSEGGTASEDEESQLPKRRVQDLDTSPPSVVPPQDGLDVYLRNSPVIKAVAPPDLMMMHELKLTPRPTEQELEEDREIVMM